MVKRIFDMRSTIKKATIEMDYEEYINLMWILDAHATSARVQDLHSSQEARLLKKEIEESDEKFIWTNEDV